MPVTRHLKEFTAGKKVFKQIKTMLNDATANKILQESLITIADEAKKRKMDRDAKNTAYERDFKKEHKEKVFYSSQNGQILKRMAQTSVIRENAIIKAQMNKQ